MPDAQNVRISAIELAEMEVDAARGDLKAFDAIRLLAEVRWLQRKDVRLRERILREEAFRYRLREGVRQLLDAYDPEPGATCVLCRLFPEQRAEHDRLHHKLDIQDAALVELPIEPPPTQG